MAVFLSACEKKEDPPPGVEKVLPAKPVVPAKKLSIPSKEVSEKAFSESEKEADAAIGRMLAAKKRFDEKAETLAEESKIFQQYQNPQTSTDLNNVMHELYNAAVEYRDAVVVVNSIIGELIIIAKSQGNSAFLIKVGKDKEVLESTIELCRTQLDKMESALAMGQSAHETFMRSSRESSAQKVVLPATEGAQKMVEKFDTLMKNSRTPEEYDNYSQWKDVWVGINKDLEKQKSQ